ncbi:OLC1v1037082C1 [Oldenlandia corymbosa var. corymbosa]|uniref:OLC1v1037082C1 n=1 Tax=Oldenlandia corymbosa var. corymbosa TaxID=529605 RepID=A0AAV1D029_OLDCO|nr:OLC1v1037082C1 [Oldenlandia corymbosa var. corymbosa]
MLSASVMKIMKKVLPPEAKISEEAKDSVQMCVTEFISFISGEANDKCKKEHRKINSPEDGSSLVARNPVVQFQPSASSAASWPLGPHVAPPVVSAFAAPLGYPGQMGQYYYPPPAGFFGAAPSAGFPAAAGIYDHLPMFNDNPSTAGGYPSGEPG